MKIIYVLAALLVVAVTTVQKAEAEGYGHQRVVQQAAPVYAPPQQVFAAPPVYQAPAVQVQKVVRIQRTYIQQQAAQTAFANDYGCVPQANFAPVFVPQRTFVQQQFVPSYSSGFGASVNVNVGRQGGLFRNRGVVRTRTIVR